MISFIVEFAREIAPADFNSIVQAGFKEKLSNEDDIGREEKELLQKQLEELASQGDSETESEISSSSYLTFKSLDVKPKQKKRDAKKLQKTLHTKLNHGRWNQIEIAQFGEAMILHGNDYKLIANYIGTRSHQAVRERFRTSDMKDLAPIQFVRWTEKEIDHLIDGIRDYGMNYEILNQLFQNRDRNSIKNKCRTLKKQIRENPETQAADILPTL